MKSGSNRKIFYVTWICIAAVILVTVWTLIRSSRPSQGKPYERLDVEDAEEYMSYEAAFVLADVRTAEEYRSGHLDRAVSLPYDSIVQKAGGVIGSRDETVYVYGKDSDQSCAAAQKLSDMGYTSVSEIGSYSDWISYMASTETEDIFSNELI